MPPATYVKTESNKPAVDSARASENARAAMIRSNSTGVAGRFTLPWRLNPAREITTVWHS